MQKDTHWWSATALTFDLSPSQLLPNGNLLRKFSPKKKNKKRFAFQDAFARDFLQPFPSEGGVEGRRGGLGRSEGRKRR